MRWKKNLVLVSIVLVVVISTFSAGSSFSKAIPGDVQTENFDLLTTSDISNLEILQSVFDANNADYATYGYYPQIYSGSLQATYYALYVLDAIGKLGDIDQQAVIDYILSFYNSSSYTFSDENSDRYFASKIPGRYYPLSTFLQVNCYAILSLDILNAINLIDIDGMIDFIWSSYHPNLHGFIGQSYDPSLEEGFKVPTADNTYYAVFTLDVLGVDWNAHSQERSDLASYIDNLQSLGSSSGFYNDNEGMFDSLLEPEPNQLASYYCLKTLEIFGSSYIDIIDKTKFHQHLTDLYHSEGAYFDLSDSVWVVNYSNIVATAINLELSDITGFTNFVRSDVVSFIFTNRDYRGGWEASTSVKYHELIDTFQIVRSLSNTGDIFALSLGDKDEISLFITLFAQERGYSLLSEDYTSVDLIYSLVTSYEHFGKIGELNIQSIYDLLVGTAVDRGDKYDFFSCTGMDLEIVNFRSKPFDYYTDGYRKFVDEINSISSHQNIFKSLNSLKKIYKLNDFASLYDLQSLLQAIIDSQFLDPSYTDNFGGFLININIGSTSEWKNDLVYLKYSYYAIQTMEIISQYFGLGNITGQYFADLGFDKSALATYIVRNIVETPTELYFDAKYSDDVELALENLYDVIYILNAIDQLSLNAVKIKNFVENHLNYSNAKNLYYSYKISEFLNLNINFDVEQTHLLVENIYSDTYNEFYLSTERKELEHDVFMWLCEIAKTDDVRLSASYSDTVRLGGNNLFTVELVNLILSDFGQYSTVKIESPQLGNIVLDQLGNYTYQKEVEVPKDSANYPTVEGELCAYDGAIKKKKRSIHFYY
ncbi:MAG: prenyltransferase/squalene oxidase repeat-containing protein [Promethearchaeota archaeon]